MLQRTTRTGLGVTVLVLLVTGCHSGALPRKLTAQDLNDKGVVCGSIDRCGTVFLRNLETHEVYKLYGDQDWKTLFSGQPPESTRFAMTLPPGNYELFRAQKTRAAGAAQAATDWYNFEAPLQVNAGEIQYLGEIQLDLKPKANSFAELVVLAAMKPFETVEDANRTQITASNSWHNDLEFFQAKFSEVPWHEARTNLDVWENLTAVSDPLNSKRWRGVGAMVANPLRR